MIAPFKRAWWLPGPHLQTIWGRAARRKDLVQYRREILLTPDDDDLVLDHLDGRPDHPHVVVLHGLEGSSHSVYAQALAQRLNQAGSSVTVMNFRGCARDPHDHNVVLPNRGRRLYHSGETSDLDLLLRTLAARQPGRQLAALGVSLGGNVLLKWLGENAGGPVRLAAAAAMSVPFDLAAGARGLEEGFMQNLYTRMFLTTLRERVHGLVARHPEMAAVVDLARADRARTFFQFDDAATAPLHGFAGADDYYARSSSLGFLGRIDTPVLSLSAMDDPFQPRPALAAAQAAASDSVQFIVTSDGGHVGFVQGPAPGRSVYWGEDLVVRWLLEKMGLVSRRQPGSLTSLA